MLLGLMMPPINEQTGFIILVTGLVLVAVGYFWLVIRAFRSSVWWGLAAFLLAPLGGLVYAASHCRRSWMPVMIVLLGGLVAVSPIVINRYAPQRLGEVRNVTTGEADLTITGLSGYDYSSLAVKTDLTVLQMANPDVTDAAIEYLRGLTQLKRLDLSDTGITDAAIPVLASLPALEDVKLARTKLTDEGVKKLLAGAARLRAIDVRGTGVRALTLRDWKNADRENRTYLK